MCIRCDFFGYYICLLSLYVLIFLHHSCSVILKILDFVKSLLLQFTKRTSPLCRWSGHNVKGKEFAKDRNFEKLRREFRASIGILLPGDKRGRPSRPAKRPYARPYLPPVPAQAFLSVPPSPTQTPSSLTLH